MLSLGVFLGGALAPSLRAELTDAEKKALFVKTHSGASGTSASSKSSNSKGGQGSKSSKSTKKSGSSTSSSYSNSASSKHSSSGSQKSSSSGTKKKSTSTTSSKSKASSHSGSHNLSTGAPHASKAASSTFSASSASSSANASKTSKVTSSSPPPAGALLPAAAAAVAIAPSGEAASTPASSPLPPSLSLPHGATPSAPITIEKSGLETAEGLEPAATPAPATVPAGGGLWSRLFGSRRSYSYLNSSTRAAIDRAPVRKGRWKYIVVHNSGTREGNARVFDIYHLRVRHMQNGLAYHFVIGDGHGSGDGQIEIGNRWTRQINGGHVASDYLNDIALGICLVGDFNRDTPTKAQVVALEELVSYLRDRVGKTQGRKAIVHAHKEINPRPTDCPGDHFPYGWLHAKFGNAR